MGQHKDNDRVKLFKTQIGIDATVERTKERGESQERANAKLRELGEELNPMPAGMKYMGSAAMHVYYNETLKQIMMVDQYPLKDCPEHLGRVATKNFIGTLMEYFGMRRPKLRSGF